MAADENLLQLPTQISFNRDVIESPNLCDRFKKDDLAKLGEWVYDGYKRDLSSRSKWERRTRAAMDLAMQIQKQKNFPWPGCFTPDTEVLTWSGWKGISTVEVGELVYSLSPTGQGSFEKVTGRVQHPATELVHFVGKSIDLLVTKNHKMVLEDKLGRRKFLEAEEFLYNPVSYRYIPLCSERTDTETPAEVHDMATEAYVRLLGWYIAEGWAVQPHNDNQTATTGGFGIGQSREANPYKYQLVKQAIKDAGIDFTEQDSGFYLRARSMSESLKEELRSLGRAADKHIPRRVLHMNARMLGILMEGLLHGDGTVRPGKDWAAEYYTSSKRLADDIQEACQYLGVRGRVYLYAAAGEKHSYIRGSCVTNKQDIWAVSINKKPLVQVAKLERKLVSYSGEVFCVETAPHHTLYVRRKGKAVWCGNCSAVAFPLVTIAALQFSANSYEDIIQGTDVVQYRVIGDDPGGLVAARADRVGRHMSWQCLEQDQAWEEQHDRLLINLAVVGTAFIKTYWDADLAYPVGDLVTAQDLVVNYWAKSLETAARKTQRTALYRNEIYSRIKRGVFRDVRGEGWYSSIPVMPSDQDAERDNRLGVNPIQPDAQSPFPCLEQHTFFDLDHDGYAEPYIVTIEESSHCVLRITARVEDESAVERNVSKEIVSVSPKEYYTKYPFIANPDGGFYDLGFGVLMGPLNESVSTIVNQMIDNGTLHNASGGFIGRGVNLRGGPYTMAPFEFRRVDATGDDIRKNLYVFEPQETPQVLFSLLGLLIEYSNRIAGTTDVMVGENPGQNTPASTFQGLQERGMRIYGWIFKRIWRAMKGEFKQRFELNGHWMPSRVNFGQQNALVYAEDYIGNPGQIAPVADPNLPSSVMRQQQALLVGQRALAVPGYDHDEVEKNVLRAFKVQNPARLYLGVERAKPLPNPKVQMEQFKLQAKQLELKAKQLEWANKLMEDRRLNDAKILELHAQAYSLIKGVQGAEAAQQLERFELVLNTLGEYSKHLTQRISELSNASQSRGSDGAGVGGVEGNADDAGLAGDASAAEGAAQGGPGGGGGGNGAAPGGAE